MELPSELLKTQVQRGTILHSTMFENIDHGKFFVVIGISKDYIAGFFFINSNINRFIIGKQELLDMQYPMMKKDYSFLSHDSFLSATRIEKIPISKVIETMEKGTTRIVDVMKEEHLSELLSAARKSRLFSKIQKEQFLY